jgi:DNA-damage-inducible protein D
MSDENELQELPEHRSTMDGLERLKRVAPNGIDYWHAREIMPVLGYPEWDKFLAVVTRAMNACSGAGISPPHHFRQTAVMMKLGKTAQRSGVDYQLTRAACYLVAMNADPAKPAVAAAQAYFARQTRRMELQDQLTEDEKRLELRDKVSESMKRVSGVAQDAGVRSQMFGVFHDQRYQGLYNMSGADVKRSKGLGEKDNFFDHAGPLELSAHDFQMNLAADVIDREKVRGEQAAIRKNRAVGAEVREAIRKSGATMPEALPLAAEPIAAVRKRLGKPKQKKLPSSSTSAP